MDDFTLSSVRLRGHTLRYVDHGEGPAIVLVHGLLGSHLLWAHLIADLAVDHRVVVPDLFGHGASDKPRGDYSLSGHAATLRELLDHLGVERAALVGHSLGGGIAMQFGYLFPARAERLVLVATTGISRKIALLLRLGAIPLSEFFLPLLASKPVLSISPRIARGLVKLAVPIASDYRFAWRGYVSLRRAANRRAFLASTRSVFDPRGQSVIGQERQVSGAPTMIVWGRNDRLIPTDQARTAAGAISGSRLEIFEASGHFPHLDERQRFLDVLRDFLTATH